MPLTPPLSHIHQHHKSKVFKVIPVFQPACGQSSIMAKPEVNFYKPLKAIGCTLHRRQIKL